MRLESPLCPTRIFHSQFGNLCRSTQSRRRSNQKTSSKEPGDRSTIQSCWWRRKVRHWGLHRRRNRIDIRHHTQKQCSHISHPQSSIGHPGILPPHRQVRIFRLAWSGLGLDLGSALETPGRQDCISRRTIGNPPRNTLAPLRSTRRSRSIQGNGMRAERDNFHCRHLSQEPGC